MGDVNIVNLKQDFCVITNAPMLGRGPFLESGKETTQLLSPEQYSSILYSFSITYIHN